MKAIVDADPLVYMVGFGHDNMPFKYQCKMMDSFIEDILQSVEATDAKLYLTGKGNFREEVAQFQRYKGNRDGTHRPRKYRELRDYLIAVWDAELVEGMEADDAVGIDAYRCRDERIDYIICTIDKDLLMLEGNHYNYKRKEFDVMSEIETWRFFFTQMLTGDSSDHIPGLFKVTGTRASKAIKEQLLELSTCVEMAEYVKKTYMEKGATSEVLKEIATLLWIRRTENGMELERILEIFDSPQA
jgi:5'-3' exonuclease